MRRARSDPPYALPGRLDGFWLVHGKMRVVRREFLVYWVSSMRMLRKLIAVMLLVLWAPMTSHCSWEPLVESQLFKCLPVTHDDATESGDCSDEGDACLVVESGDYKIPHNDLDLPAPSFSLVLFELPAPDCLTAANVNHDPAPPDHPPIWRFYLCTALPARAPSLA